MSNSSKSAFAFLIGAAIGAGIGILLAPDKGSNTRGKIKNGFDDKKTEFKNRIGDLNDKFKSKLDTSKTAIESSFDELAANVDEKTKDVILTLEKNLQSLNEQLQL